jgi:excisionase family DNA binding protein
MNISYLLTAEQLSYILDISEFTILKMAKNQELPCIYNGTHPRFSLETIKEHFEEIEEAAA